MPDRRQHRGAHPRDPELFGAANLPALQAAAADYAWLLTRGYAAESSLSLVGNRYDLTARQRTAVSRVTCSDAAAERRRSRQLAGDRVQGERLHVDGFNVCITLEVALSGGVVLVGRDGAHRDLASVHGTYRRVSETPRALELLVSQLERLKPGSVSWYFDRPVSNSGTLAGMVRELLGARALDWAVELTDDVDRRVSAAGCVAVSGDSGVLDAAERWLDLVGIVIETSVPAAWRLAPWR